MSASAVALWVGRAGHQRLDRLDFSDGKPGRAANRVLAAVERRILRARRFVRTSVLGEYGALAIARELAARHPDMRQPSRPTIRSVLVRHGVVDAAHRQRRSPPPKGWYLPDVAQAQAELDSSDFIDGCKSRESTVPALPR